MEIKGDPRPERGERNIFCPRYGNCLNYAIQSNWEKWSCSRCPHRFNVKASHDYEYPTAVSAFCYEWPCGEGKTDECPSCMLKSRHSRQ